MKSFYHALVFLFFTATIGLHAQRDIDLVNETVSRSKAEAHIYFLADDALQGRKSGTQGGRVAAAYLANMLRAYGALPNPATGDYYQEVLLEEVRPAKLERLSIGDLEMEQAIVIKPGDLQYEGRVLPLSYGLKDDYTGRPVGGQVVMVRGGSSTESTPQEIFGLLSGKREHARAHGALALIELVSLPANVWASVQAYFGRTNLRLAEEPDGFVHILMNIAESSQVKKLMGKRRSNSSIKVISSPSRRLTTRNVVGLIPGMDQGLKDQYMVYSGHYDHLGVGEPNPEGDSIYNGARDNGIGVASILSMAEHLGRYPTRRSALFIFFAAEEMGLLGSSYFVEHPVVPLEQIAYCFNSDGGGYNDTSKITIIGLDRTSEREQLLTAAETFGLEAIENPSPEQGLFDRSDNVNFARKGIPAPTFSPGFTEFGPEVMRYYHQVTDEASSIDYEYLEKMIKTYVLAGRYIANDAPLPTWVPGDKYEAAYRELHGE